MNNQIQLVLKSSTTELSLNDHELGIYLTPELDGLTGLPEIRTTSGVNAGYDGGWTSAQNYDARSITIRGVIANEDVATVEQLRRQLTTLAGQGKNEELTLDLVTQAGKAYTIQVRTIALEMSLQKVLTQQEFMLQLRADDPLIYDASETTHEALLQVAQATGGFTIDFELPLAITGSSEETIVNNEGLEQVPTVTRMYGALHNPKLINQTTNQSMQIMADLGFAEGDWTTPSEPVEGKDLTINGAPENALLSDFKLKGNTEQDTYSGKNKFGDAVYTVYVYSSGLPTNASTGITINSSDSNNISFTYGQNAYKYVLTSTLTLQPNTTYTISYNRTDSVSDNNNRNYIYDVDANGAYSFTAGITSYVNATGDVAITFTTNSVGKVAFAWGSSNNQTGRTITINNIQLELGNSASSFEQYCGGTASPNPDYPQAVEVVTGENVVKICGKNLINVVDSEVTQATRCTHEVVDGGVKIVASGASGLSYCMFDVHNQENILGKTVYISCNEVAEVISAHIRVYQFNNGAYTQIGNNIPISGGSVSIPATLISDTSIIRVGFYVSSGTAAAGTALTITNAQLELGSTATAYEPYQEQRYPIDLGGTIELDMSQATRLDAYINGSGVIVSSDANALFGIAVEPNTTYTITKIASSRFRYVCTSTTPAIGATVGTTTNNDSATSVTVTTGASDTYLVCTYWSNTSTSTKDDVFNSVKITTGGSGIELCKLGDYQDYIYKDGESWKVHKTINKYTYDGSEDWDIQNSGTANYYYRLRTLGQTSNSGQRARMTHFSWTSDSISASTTVQGFRAQNGTTENWQVRIRWGAEKTIQDFKAWLATLNPTLYIINTTPTDTEITNQALVAQLEAILQEAKMYNPQTNITTLYAQGNEQGTLSISYFTDKNPDTRDELVIDSRLRTITLNGLDVYHLQAPGSEFLMLAPGENRLALQSDITGDNGYAQVSYKQGYLSI